MEFKELEERIDLIKEKLNSDTVSSSSIIGSNDTKIDVSLIKLPIKTLIFNPENTRIRTDILSELGFEKNSDEAMDEFYQNKENKKLQKMLFEWCLREAGGTDERVEKNIYKRLKTLADQQYPILISRTGVIVDGNRRYASMLHLFNSDDAKYHKFENIECEVLPEPDDNERKQNREIESAIHLAADFQQEHSYIDKSLNIEHMIDNLDYTFQRLAKSLGYANKTIIEKHYWYSKALQRYIEYRKTYDENFKDITNVYKEIDNEGIQQDLFQVGNLIKQGNNNIETQAEKNLEIQLIFIVIFGDKLGVESISGRTYGLTSKSKKMLQAFAEDNNFNVETDIVKLNKKLKEVSKYKVKKLDEFINNIQEKIDQTEEEEEDEQNKQILINIFTEINKQTNLLKGHINEEYILEKDIPDAENFSQTIRRELEQIETNIKSLYTD